MNIGKMVLILISIVALNACQKKVGGDVTVQSLDFYSKYPDSAKSVAEKCMEYERGELSRLDARQQQEWQDSLEGVNCNNAKTARSLQIIGERQKQLREAAKALRQH
ncbi:hypothetical protein GTP44_20495 [Duganella sp. FT50W]|uniref:Uncharacterized protein n=1 Tax=Duganella lactea TaxID=2692173 RepID=A0A6L8MMA9_9BURK|nr:hypothetical protein [Duganella lactea]MYM84320.1 hypothetical protein [Duganella lactea]